ncbi:hypothetical protein RI129_000897 [Pyrocoelia pectoralis]|uniref:Uncharacterized protein n=1 Tax=Pyrocoelia pectoralis TaxID=417401 RepID=A0AAN7ZWI7_9COLE
MDGKLLDITNREAIERERQNKFIAATHKINDLKKKINETDTQTVLFEKESNALKEECNNLRIEEELQNQLTNTFKSKNASSEKLLGEEEAILEDIQNTVYKNLNDYINKVQNAVEEKHTGELDDFIQIRNVLYDIGRVKKEVSVLEGEVRALNLFIKCQENQTTSARDMILFLRSANVHGDI